MKSIILNSGGFDSVVLIHALCLNNTETEYTSLFFNYGQRNLEQERKSAIKVAEKFDLKHYEITIPRLPWSNSDLLSEGSTENFVEYVEMRNVIFLSYALSLAESIGAEEINSAILYGGTYTDTNESFINNTRDYFKSFGIKFNTLFDSLTKIQLGYLARTYGIQQDDFFTCNKPVKGKPCGECNDCKDLEYVFNEIIANNYPVKELVTNGLTPKFKELFMKSPITEARLLINNKCQFKCSHCFYGFDETLDTEFTEHEMYKVIDEIASIPSINNIHFSGKEPLVNEDIFKYTKYIKEHHPRLTFDVVTNGVNVAKYIDQLKDFKKVYISVDNLNEQEMKIRPRGNHVLGTLQTLLDHNIKTEVFLDMHKGNYKNIKSMVIFLSEVYDIKEFFIRTVCPLGQGKSLENILSASELEYVYKELKYLDLAEDVTFTFCMQTGFTKAMLEYEGESELQEDIEYVYSTSFSKVTPHMTLLTELYCGSCESQITITSDGYLLGCGTEVSSPKYTKISGGRLLDVPLQDLIENKKKKTLDILERQGDTLKPCPHTFYKISQK